MTISIFFYKLYGVLLRKLSFLFSDKLYIRLKFRHCMGFWPNIDQPITFNEKLQWLKLYNRNPEYTTMVDKFLVKDYVKQRIGESFLIKTLGYWKTPDEIDFDCLPEKFVLKTTHGGGGGGVIICKDKTTLDFVQVRRKLTKALKQNIYRNNREWPYKNVEHAIIAEEFIESPDELNDYKFFCFNGKVKYFKIDFNRFVKHQANYFDEHCTLLPFGEVVCPPDLTKELPIPANINEMIDVAEKLSKEIPFIRVDLYNVDGRIYFGELTFFPAAGMGPFVPEEWDSILGEWLKLPKRKS